MIHRCRVALVLAPAVLLAAASPAVGQQLDGYNPGAPATQAYAPSATAALPPVAAATLPAQPGYGQAPPAAAINPGAPQPGQPVAPPQPPFVLDEGERQFVVQTLQMWEAESAKIKTFNSEFERLDFDAVWGPGADTPLLVCRGTLSYSKPDKGSFKIDETKRWTKKDPQNPAADAPGEYVVQKEVVGEHWVCDGKAVYEYNHREKQLVVNQIPENMRGQEIVNGPLPFLFGAQAQQLMDRYYIKPVTSDEQQIRLLAMPRRQSDAANYDAVEVILDRKTMQPNALMVVLPGGQQRHVYKFESPTINGKMEAWFGGLFSSPRTPIGWKRVVVEAGAPDAQAANPGDGVQR